MHFAVQKDVFLTLNMAKRVGGRGSAPDPAGGAYDVPPDPLVGWGGDTPPRPTPLSAFGARYSAPRISHLRRSILAFPLLLIYEMTTGAIATILFRVSFKLKAK